jgi:undecaprenyl-diphosphatase
MLSARGRTWLAGLTTGLLLVMLDVFTGGPLVRLDLWVHRFDGQAQHPSWDGVAQVYDKVGQRSVTIPVLLVVAGVLARRHRTWRPVLLSVYTVLSLNVVVGGMKILIGRSETETGDPDVFAGGVIFPSGHAANMVLTGGLVIYLLRRYAGRPRTRLLVVVVSVLTALTVATSIYIGSHWASDLIGGALVGGLLLQAVIVIDRATAKVRTDPPALLTRPLLRLGRLEGDGDAVDAEPVPGRRLGSVVEDVPQVRPAAPAPDLRSTHAE